MKWNVGARQSLHQFLLTYSHSYFCCSFCYCSYCCCFCSIILLLLLLLLLSYVLSSTFSLHRCLLLCPLRDWERRIQHHNSRSMRVSPQKCCCFYIPNPTCCCSLSASISLQQQHHQSVKSVAKCHPRSCAAFGFLPLLLLLPAGASE